VEQCLATLNGVPAGMLLVFCGGKHDGNAVLSALRPTFPNIPVVGGSAAGAISQSGYGYSGLELALAAFPPDVVPQIFVNYDLRAGEFEAGQALAREVSSAAADGALVLLFYDSVSSTSPPRLHPASSLVSGFEAGLAGKPVKLVGGGTLTDFNLSDGWVYDGAAVRKHAAVALLFPPGITAETTVLHGCRPASAFMEITRIDGAEVFELNGEPALHVIERMLHLNVGGSRGNELSLVATLGQKQGDPYAPYDENAYVNRLILTSDRERGSVTLFEPDFECGSTVQIMSRDNSLMIDSVREGVATSNKTIERGDCLLSLYVDCAGRASARSGSPVEEAAVVIESIDHSVPLLGFYSGVEIAPFEGYSRPLDWTGLLAVLRRRR
jgi:hypothetical protein